jgi:hypothetical protein
MKISAEDTLKRCASLKWTLLVVCAFASALNAHAASWNGIEPLKSRRDDVLKILGKPVREGKTGTLHFEVAGGDVIVSFVDEKFVNTKKLRPELVGTVLEIVLQHGHSSDTPESMKLLNNKVFGQDRIQNATIFRNPKEGIVYTFLDGKLSTTRYTFSDGQLGRARRQ